MLDPGQLERTFGRAVELHKERRFDEAEPLYRAVLKAAPNHPDVLHHLGILFAQQGNHNEALKHFQRALKQRPKWPEALSNTGNALRALKRHSEAILAYRKALELDPRYADALYNLGVAFSDLRRLPEAVDALERAAQLMPHDAELLGALGTVLRELKRYEEAVQCLNAAIILDPKSLGAFNDLGISLASLHRYEEAEAAFRRALGVDPRFYKAWNNLGNLLTELGRHAEALEALRRALELAPDVPDLHSSVGTTLTALGRYKEAVAEFDEALRLNPEFVEASSRLVFTRDLMPETGFREHAEACRAWYERHGKAFAKRIVRHGNSRDPQRTLRVGYVSADFKRHSAAACFSPVIHNHDPEEFDVFLYSETVNEDAETDRFRSGRAHWRRTVELSDDQLAERVRSDGIDVLVDLSAFSRGNRLAVFARKPAPVQLSAWGYAVSTGLPAIDYHFSDPVAVPHEARQYYTETVIDLPCCIGFQPPDHAPDVDLERVQGPVRFGCLNRLTKMSDLSIRLWARVLQAAPGSRLVLKDVRFGDEAERRRVQEIYAAAGIDPERLVLLPRTSHAEHLGTYGQVDVALDPMPHTGGVSTFEALWMGTPVVTLLGNSFPARLSGSILSMLGLDHWIARTEDEYVDIAVRLAADVDTRAALRRTLRQRVLDSGVCDERYCRAVEAAYRQMWIKYCESAKP